MSSWTPRSSVSFSKGYTLLIPRPQSQTVVLAVKDIFEHGHYADKVIEGYLKNNKKWSGPERQFFSETVYELVRWWRRLWAVVGKDPSTDEKELWDVFAAWLWQQRMVFPEWPEFSFCSFDDFEKNKVTFEGQRAIEESIPDWLDKLGDQQLGERWPAVLQALNQPSEVVLRLNTSRGSAFWLITSSLSPI